MPMTEREQITDHFYESVSHAELFPDQQGAPGADQSFITVPKYVTGLNSY